MSNESLRPFTLPWGHCMASPSRAGSDFMRFLDACEWELLSM